MVVKYFNNDTRSEIELTLYIADIMQEKLITEGTRIMSIASGENLKFQLKKTKNAVIQGIRIQTKQQGEFLSLQRGTHEATGDLFSLLNDNHLFRISECCRSFAINPVTS